LETYRTYSCSIDGIEYDVESSGGRNYSFAEIPKMPTDVGFTNIEKRSLAGPAEIVMGYKE
jgi:hypothetical protein